MKKLVLSIALGGAVLTMAACKKHDAAAENAAANVADANAADMATDANAMGMSNAGSAEPIDNAANAAMSMETTTNNSGDRENNGDRK
ncbi:hypothetical protein SPAN111604_11225 [Sphingomonas antarctica]|uniref:hypothetical protein n=1 Tax=Sphingomonas antarctica TaxID=2040274 RepID=UPI0039EC28AA